MKIFNYKLTPFDFYRIRVVLVFGFVTAIITLLYSIFTDLIDSSPFWIVITGFKLGAFIGICEEFIFHKLFKKFRLVYMVLLRAFVYMIFIAWMFIGLEVFMAILNREPVLESFNIIFTKEFLINFIFTLCVFDFMIFFNQTSKLFGHTTLINMWSGKYRYPIKEDRIFMFLDLVSSTEISSKLEHVKYFRLINEFFHDLTIPVLRAKGHIYQYVGDEVVITWKLRDGLKDNNCVYLFHLIQEQIIKKSQKYFKEFGLVPRFKAGLHCGEVITAEVGDLKTEIIHNGEVVNIAARIRSACTDYQRDLLISKELKDQLKFSNNFETEKIGNIILKGVPEPMELFAIEPTNKNEIFSDILTKGKVG